MAITTRDQLIAGFMGRSEDYIKAAVTGEAAGLYHSPVYLAGCPGAASAPSAGINGAALTGPRAGYIPIPAAVGGKTVYLARVEAAHAGGVGQVTFVDRLWENSGLSVTTTTAQAITPAALPARDEDGTTAGRSVFPAIEVVTATTNAAAVTNTTISYTNSAGTAGRTGTIASFPATAVAGTFVPFTLAAGDVGVRSVESVTLGTSYGGGAISLVMYRDIVSVGTPLANTGYQQGPLDMGLPVLFDGTVLQPLYLMSATAVGIVNLLIAFAQG